MYTYFVNTNNLPLKLTFKAELQDVLSELTGSCIMCSISQELYAQCLYIVVLWLLILLISFSVTSLALGNSMPMNHPWRISVNISHEFMRNKWCNHNTTKPNKTQYIFHYCSYTAIWYIYYHGKVQCRTFHHIWYISICYIHICCDSQSRIFLQHPICYIHITSSYMVESFVSTHYALLQTDHNIRHCNMNLSETNRAVGINYGSQACMDNVFIRRVSLRRQFPPNAGILGFLRTVGLITLINNHATAS